MVWLPKGYDAFGNRTYAEYPSTYDEDPNVARERKIQLAQQGMTSQEAQGIQGRASEEARARIAAEAQTQSAAEAAAAHRYAADAQARAAIESMRLRMRGGSGPSGTGQYAKGGPVESMRPGPANTRDYAKGGKVR